MKDILNTEEAWTHAKTFCVSSTLFCFDFDGTLAAIAENPKDVMISPTLYETLVELSAIAAVAIISGRSRAELNKYVASFSHYTFGNHGAEDEFEKDAHPDVLYWQQSLRESIQGLEGVWVEEKNLSLSVHYRQAKNHHLIKTQLLKLIGRLQPKPYVVGGKFVINLLPEGAPTKSHALMALIKKNNFPAAVFLGDDANDEDVFRLESKAILGVKVGKDKESRALYFLQQQSDVELFLTRCLRELKQRKSVKNELSTPLFG